MHCFIVIEKLNFRAVVDVCEYILCEIGIHISLCYKRMSNRYFSLYSKFAIVRFLLISWIASP